MTSQHILIKAKRILINILLEIQHVSAGTEQLLKRLRHHQTASEHHVHSWKEDTCQRTVRTNVSTY